MKHKNIILLFVFSCYLFVSCDKLLDLAPEDTTVEKEVFLSVSSAESALMDVYNKTFEIYKSLAYTIGDITTDILISNESYYKSLIEGTLSSDDYAVKTIWASNYSAINVANVMINSIPKYGKYNENAKKQHISEAKFLRAFNYLTLLKLYSPGTFNQNDNALGVPLHLKPYGGEKYDASKALERSTTGEVYSQIINDLEDAIAYLPEKYPDDINTRCRATKYSAYALLSRIYLYRKNYQKVIEYAQKVINSDSYRLAEDMKMIFPKSGGYNVPIDQELIYSFPVTFNNGNHQYGVLYYSYYYKIAYYLSPEFIKIYSDTDQRLTKLIYKGYPEGRHPKELTTFKFNNPEGRDNVSVMRLSEMYLNVAEAVCQINGVNQESITYLNTIAKRADDNFTEYKETDFASKEELLERILLERKKEFACEGIWRFDLIRNNLPLNFPNLPKTKLVFPIPKSEVDITKGKIIQNEGY